MPGIDRTAFTVFGRDIYWYGILIATGILMAYFVGAARQKRFSLANDTMLDTTLWVLPLSIIGARAYYVAFTFEQYADNLLRVFDLRGGGMAIYGGVLGGMLAIAIVARRKRVPMGTLMDLLAPGVALGQAIGRWGNFVNQEAYGRAVEWTSLQFFPIAVYIEAQQGWFYATFFYKSVWCLLICVTLLLLERRQAFHRPGDETLWYLILYGVERALVEGLRTDSLYWGTVRVSQALSVVLVLSALAIYCIRRTWRRPK